MKIQCLNIYVMHSHFIKFPNYKSFQNVTLSTIFHWVKGRVSYALDTTARQNQHY